MCLICEEEGNDDDGKAIYPTTDDGMVQCGKVLRRRRRRLLSVRLEVCASVITGVRYEGDGPNELLAGEECLQLYLMHLLQAEGP